MAALWVTLLISALVFMNHGRYSVRRDNAERSDRAVHRKPSFPVSTLHSPSSGEVKSTPNLETMKNATDVQTTVLDGLPVLFDAEVKHRQRNIGSKWSSLGADQRRRATFAESRSNFSAQSPTRSNEIETRETLDDRGTQQLHDRQHLDIVSEPHPPLHLDQPEDQDAFLAPQDRRSLGAFHKYMKDYNRTYAIGSNEYYERFHNFLATVHRQPTLLAALADEETTTDVPSLAIYGLNQFSDLSVGEFRQRYLTLKAPKFQAVRHDGVTPKKMRRHMKRRGYPLKWDWRNMGVVTPIRNQDRCGACYAVSVVSMVESMRSIYLGRLSELLSVQQVLDCSSYSHQCGGGDPFMVLDWMNGTRRCRANTSRRGMNCYWTHKHGLAFERDYPTVFVNQYCVKRINRVGVARIKDYFCKYSMDEVNILAYLYKHGPITVGVDSTSWQDYLGGIIQHNCHENLNHAVLIVGYDISGPIPYYIVKNSWGENFGHEGYVYIRAGMNVCGIQGEVCGASI